MPKGNTDLTREAFAMWQAGRIAEFAAFLDPNVEWDISTHPLPDFPDAGSGRDAFLHHLGEYASGWLDYETSEVEVIEVGDDVVTVVHERATMRGSEVRLDRDIAIVWTVEGERFTRFRVFRTRDEALAALGGADR